MRYRKSGVLGLALFGALALAACTEENVIQLPDPEVEVTVSPAVAELEVGETVQLVAAVKNGTSQGVSFVSNNGSVASVSGTGLVTANAPGTTTITVTSTAHPEAPATAATIVVKAPPPPPEVEITLQPAEVEVFVGQSVQLVATVTGNANTNATCEGAPGSSGIATVTAACLVTGVSPGTVVVTATASADDTKKATSVVTVVAPPEPSISIESIVFPVTFVAVNPNNVAGNIIVNLEFDVPPGSGVTGVELWLGERLVGSQSFSAAVAESGEEALAEWAVPVATHAFCTTDDPQTSDASFCTRIGEPRNHNGPVTLSARLVQEGGEPAAQVDQQLTLNNSDRFFAHASTIPVTSASVGGWAVNPNTNRRYHEGNVAVSLFFVDYSDNELLESSVAITLQNGGGGTRTGNLSTTFPKSSPPGSGGVGGVTSGAAVVIQIAGQYVGGNPLPGSASPPAFTQWNGEPSLPELFAPGMGITQESIFLDNQGPNLGTYQFTTQSLGGPSPQPCCLLNWIGREKTFSSFYSTAGESDAGVGVPSGSAHRSFHVGLAGENANTIAANDPVTTGQDIIDILGLSSTVTNDVYASAVKVVDRLFNATTGKLQTDAGNTANDGEGGAEFGLDVLDPEGDHTSNSTRHMYVELVEANSIDFELAYIDPGLHSSGFGPEPIRFGYRSNFGSFSYSDEPGPSPATVTILGGNQRYHGATFQIFDRAGNSTDVLSERIVLQDEDLPIQLEPLVLPNALHTENITFSAVVQDNVHLNTAQSIIRFAGVPLGAGAGSYYPTEFPISLSTPFQTPRDQALTASHTTLNIIALELSDCGPCGAGSGGIATARPINSPSGSVYLADGGGLRIRDAARWEEYFISDYGVPVPPLSPSATPFNPGVITFAVTDIDPPTVCNNAEGINCGGAATEATVTVTLVQDSPQFVESIFDHVLLYLHEDAIVPLGGHVNSTPPFGDPIRLIGRLEAADAQVFATETTRTFTWTFTVDPTGPFWGEGQLDTDFGGVVGRETSLFAVGVWESVNGGHVGLRTLNNDDLEIVGDLNPQFGP